MAKLVELRELMRYPSIYGFEKAFMGRRESLEVEYFPQKGCIKIDEERAGYKEGQNFETEKLNYYAVIWCENVYLISETTTEKELCLSGKRGYTNGTQIIEEVTDLYSNNELNAKGIPWNEGTIELGKHLPWHLNYSAKRIYWTTIKNWMYYGVSGERGKWRGFKSFDGFETNWNLLYMHFEGSSVEVKANTVISAIRPLIFLPNNILVDVEEIHAGIKPKLILP